MDVAVVADVVRVSLIWKGPLVTVAIRKKFSPRKLIVPLAPLVPPVTVCPTLKVAPLYAETTIVPPIAAWFPQT